MIKMWYSKYFIKKASPFHATPASDKILSDGYIGGIPDYAPENHFVQLFYALPEESQQRIIKVAEKSDDPISKWSEEYWPNVPEIMDVMYDELEKVFPNSQMIWALDYPTTEQLESYGPELLYFDEDDMDVDLGETSDGRAFLYHPREKEKSIPGELFRKVNPDDPESWNNAIYGWEDE